MTVKELVLTPGNRCEFRHGSFAGLWYAVVFEDGREFEFVVPHDDMKGATFLAEDEPKVFMRWIRKQLDAIEKRKPQPVCTFLRYVDGNFWYRDEDGFEFPVSESVTMGDERTDLHAEEITAVLAHERDAAVEEALAQKALAEEVLATLGKRARVSYQKDLVGVVTSYVDGANQGTVLYVLSCDSGGELQIRRSDLEFE